MSSTLRCLAVLELLAKEPYEFTLSEVAGALDTNTTTVFRALSTLVAADFVEQRADTKRFRVTGKSLWVGTAYLRHSPIYLSGFAVLEELASATGIMAHLAAWERGSVLYLHTAGPPSSQLFYSQIGERIPVHCTGLGKAMLAWRTGEELEAVFKTPPVAATPKTITALGDMLRELEQVRARGYAVDDEEGVTGVRCIAAPICDQARIAVGALSISGSLAEIPSKRVADLAEQVVQAARRVSVQLGFRPQAVALSALVDRRPLGNGARAGRRAEEAAVLKSNPRVR
jgi:DNA-binding IclR family transcriptional regulator